MSKKLALVSDFDGTISDRDFFYYVADKYFDEGMLKPWREFLSGKKKHFDALAEMFANLRVSQGELNDFISTIKIDEHFFEVAKWCVQQKIPVTICSAGNDYYIKQLMKNEIKKYNISLISNYGEYSEDKGLLMRPNEKYYDENLGVSKVAIVNDFQARGYFVIYCGDGLPDVEAACKADKIFARDMLYEECQKLEVETEKLRDFMQVKKFMEEALK